jgi:hypothetical protein
MQTADSIKPFTRVSCLSPTNGLVPSTVPVAGVPPQHAQHTLGASHNASNQSKCIGVLKGPTSTHIGWVPSQNPDPKLNRLQAAQRAVVLVKLAAGWGSGVVVDSNLGLVLTNAHLFEQRGLQKLPAPASASKARRSCREVNVAATGDKHRIKENEDNCKLPMRCECSTLHSAQCSSTDVAPILLRKETCQVGSGPFCMLRLQ